MHAVASRARARAHPGVCGDRSGKHDVHELTVKVTRGVAESASPARLRARCVTPLLRPALARGAGASRPVRMHANMHTCAHTSAHRRCCMATSPIPGRRAATPRSLPRSCLHVLGAAVEGVGGPPARVLPPWDLCLCFVPAFGPHPACTICATCAPSLSLRHTFSNHTHPDTGLETQKN